MALELPPPKLISFPSGTKEHESWRKMWEIGTPAKNSLYWSILMAYLTTPDIPDVSVVSQRRLRIIGDLSDVREEHRDKRKLNLSLDYINEVSLRRRLQNFNPFKNRHNFYYDKGVIEILLLFKWRLLRFSLSVEDSISNGIERKLEAASRMLACSIEVHYFENGHEHCTSFPKNKMGTFAEQIILFKQDDLSSNKHFRFGMNTRSATALQKKALPFFLKKAKIQTQQPVADVCSDSDEIFILSLLKCMKTSDIVKLYESPYIPLKLSEAGFETNPLAVDSNGVTAFCHAVKKENIKLSGTLYDSAVNHHWLSGNCIRKPDKCIVEGLQAMKNALDNDKMIINGFVGWSPNAKDIFDAYTRFNAFQLKFVEQVIALKKEENNFIFRRNLILALLDCYEEFSYNDDHSENDMWFQNYFNDYAKQRVYYEILDSFTCISFFDNVHYLLENISLETSTIYDDISSNFLLLLLCNNNFTIDTSFKPQGKIKLYSKKFISVIFQMNLKSKFCDLRYKVQSIKKQLHQTKNKETDKFYRRSLIDAPEIKDELILCKVKRYLEACSELELCKDDSEEENIKAVLVIQRTVQILGECLKPSSTPKCIASFLMCSCLPYDWEELITIARDFISHLKGNDIQRRLTLEKNLDLFLKMKEQLSIIHKNFQTVYSFQKQRIQRFLIKCGLQAVQMFPSDSEAVTKLSDDYQMLDNQLKKAWLERQTDYIPLIARYIMYLKLCVERFCCVVTSKNFNDKVLALVDLLEYISQYYDESASEILTWVMQCREMFPFPSENDYLLCTLHNKPMFSDITKEKFRNTFGELQKHVGQLFHQQDSHNLSPSMGPTTTEFFDRSKTYSNLTKEEEFSVITSAESMYEETKRHLDTFINAEKIEESDLKQNLQCFIFNQQCLKKNEEKVKDNKTFLDSLGTCYYTWDELKSKLDDFFRKNTLDHMGCRMLLLKLCSPSSTLARNLKQKLFNTMNQKIVFLLQRIHCIRQILIENDEEISQYFQWGRSEELKHHTKFLMIQRCNKEMNVRASLEMLLFDCLNLIGRKDLNDLWLKAEYLLAGINFRDVLAHGNVVLDTIGGMIDPKDFPTELVGKMLELVQDEEFISKMVELHTLDSWHESKKSFKAAMEKEELLDKCPRLESYLELMPFA